MYFPKGIFPRMTFQVTISKVATSQMFNLLSGNFPKVGSFLFVYCLFVRVKIWHNAKKSHNFEINCFACTAKFGLWMKIRQKTSWFVNKKTVFCLLSITKLCIIFILKKGITSKMIFTTHSFLHRFWIGFLFAYIFWRLA